ncbi:tetratricopeptide repeat protein [Bosea sp. NPDC055332]
MQALGGCMRRRLLWSSVVVVCAQGLLASAFADFRQSPDGSTEFWSECRSETGVIGSRIDACNKALGLEVRPAYRASLLTARGWQKRRAGDQNGGLRDFEAALKIVPANDAALRGRAVMLSDLGRYDEAEQAFTAMLVENETRPLIYLDRGLVRRRAGRREQALADFNAALQLAPNYVDALVQRGRLAFDRQDHAAALVDLDAATKSDPKDPSALYWYARALSEKGEQRSALFAFNRLVAIEPEDAINWVQRGSVQEGRSDYAGALRSYDLGLKQTPGHRNLLFRRAFVLSMLHRDDAAIKAYDTLIAAHPEAAAGYGNRAWHLSQKGEHAAAMRDANRAISLDPKNGQPHHVRGLIYFEKEDYRKARVAFERAAALGHTTTELFNMRGRTALGLKRYDDAAADFDEVIRRVPTAMYGHYNRGLTERLRGRWAEALGHYSKALEVEPGDEDAVRQRNEMLVKLGREREIWRLRLIETAAAIKRAALSTQNQAAAKTGQSAAERLGKLDEQLELDPYDDAARLARARLLAAAADSRARALDDVEQLLRSDPQNAATLLVRARIHYDEKRYPQTIADAERVLAKAPKESDAFFWRARARAALSQDEEAVADYTTVVALSPKSLRAIFNRGQLHRRAGRFAEAEADFSRAIELQPDDYDPWRYRGLVHLKQKRFAEAQADLEQAFRLAPDHVGTTLDLGIALYRRGEHQAAIAHLTAAIERGVTSVGIWNDRCYFHVLRREFDLARSDCAEALKLDPQRATTFHSLGAMKMHEGDVDGALAFFDRSIAGDPKSAFAHFGRALALLRKGEAGLAEEAFARARALDHEIDERYRELGLEF